MSLRKTIRTTLLAGLFSLVGCSSLCNGQCGGAEERHRGEKLGDGVSSGDDAPDSPKRAANMPKDGRKLAPIGTNMGGYLAPSSPEIPFVDVFRQAAPWEILGPGWQSVEGDFLDKDGWVRRLPADHLARTRMLFSLQGQYPSGEYLCLYDGEGQLDFDGAAKVKSREPGRIVLQVDNTKSDITLLLSKIDADNYVRNIRVIMPGHEQTYKDKPWNPRFLALLRPFGLLRFLHWIRTNEQLDGQLEWSERVTGSHYTQASEKGVSAEVMVDLANELGVDAWFSIPHGATDDYIRKFATLVRDRLDPKLKAYFEWSNETWNGAFETHWWTAEQGCKRGFNKIEPNTGACDGGPKFFAAVKFHAMRSGEMFEILDEVYANAPGRYVKVLASMSFADHSRDLIAAFEDKRINPKSSRPDALAIAPYFGGQLSGENVDHEGKPMFEGLPRDIGTWSVDQLLDVCEKLAVEMEKPMRESAELAAKHGMVLIAYEGGQHLDAANAGWDSPQQKLFLKAVQHPRMGEIYKKYFTAWRRAGGRMFAQFKVIENFKGGTFGLVQRLDEPPRSSPRFAAIVEFIENNPRWW